MITIGFIISIFCLKGDVHFNSDVGMKITEQKSLLKHCFLLMVTAETEYYNFTGILRHSKT